MPQPSTYFVSEPSPPTLFRTAAILTGFFVLTSIVWRIDDRLHSSLLTKPASIVVRAEPSEAAKAAKAPTPEVLPEPEPKEQEAPLTEADRHFLQAANAFETKDYDTAGEALQSGLALEPDNAVQQAMLGMVLSFQEAWAESAEAYRKALQVAPDNALFHLGLGVALHRQEQIEEAVDSLERAVDLNPDLGEAKGLLALLTLEPEGTLEKVWIEHNAKVKEWEGVWIHTVSTTKAWKERQGILRASFFHEDGQPVSGTFSNLVLANGQAAIEGPFTPPYRKTRYKDLHLFYPYKGLRLRKGDHRLKVQVELVDPTGKVLASRWASLTLEVIETALGAVAEARSSDVP